MVHAWVPDEYILFALIYMTDHIFPVLPSKQVASQDGEPTMPHKLKTATKPSVSNPTRFVCVLYKMQLHMLTQRD